MATTELGVGQKVNYRYSLNDEAKQFVPLVKGQRVTVTTADGSSAIIVPDKAPTVHVAGDHRDEKADQAANATGYIVAKPKIVQGLSVTFSCTEADGKTKVVPDVVQTIDIVAIPGPPAATTTMTTEVFTDAQTITDPQISSGGIPSPPVAPAAQPGLTATVEIGAPAAGSHHDLVAMVTLGTPISQ